MKEYVFLKRLDFNLVIVHVDRGKVIKFEMEDRELHLKIGDLKLKDLRKDVELVKYIGRL